jgi:predicted Zn-dependent peptidase
VETAGAVAESLGEIVTFGLPDDYFVTYPAKVRSLSVGEVQTIATEVVHPDQLVGWSLATAQGRGRARELQWAEVQLLDTDGNRAK